MDAEVILRELGPDVLQACPVGANIYAARTFVDSILAERDAVNDDLNFSMSP
ncbi:unnamed protein product [Gongylonema pulchrum]|uniref:NADH_4Fe-4S domain-containing protein n=1 Tax=Gongylonema pulchrum TaxID=637853 RepID=A0A183DPF4_9BILA|nr:unnamed protein product [Gongylonema pulchrum]